ncbi:MAG: leucine--tRNA ligase [Phycisphaerales bacterium]|nr:leucine--tRNA ligase [Phycisphaerales bacterium]
MTETTSSTHPDSTGNKSGGPAHRYTAKLATELESRWQEWWRAHDVYRTPGPGDQDFDPSKPKFYCMDMFPYPSGAGLHVGHPVGYIGSDIISRHKRMMGFNVLHPMGWDAFGLPAEQYAITTGIHPAETTRKAIETYRKQLDGIGFSYDWSREIATIDPSYYRWTQWIWLQAWGSYFDEQLQKARPISELISRLESGEEDVHGQAWNSLDQQAQQAYLDERRLAYLSEQVVNWCPKLGTALANEEVIDGKSERGGYPVHRKPLRQWMFRITAFADRLLADLDTVDWPDSTRAMQTEWIGRSEGADLDFELSNGSRLRVFTTRPDTIHGATFMVVAPEHPIVEQLLKDSPDGCDANAVSTYVEQAASRADVERMADQGDKTGVSLGITATNPATGESIPVWVADYVLMGYGHGAIMAVPGHDERDAAFARTYGLSIQTVVASGSEVEECFTGDGTVINSSTPALSLDGLSSQEARTAVTEWAEQQAIGTRKIRYRLRDWLFSRQRYWGEPFPIVHDEHGGIWPISETHLPVELPPLADFAPEESDDPQPLLAKAKDWINTTAGEAGVDPTLLDPTTPVTRESNTMPGWAGSCWYYLRYCSPDFDSGLVDPQAEKYWLADGVDLYIGGAEHAVLHLLYARFWHKMLYDLGFVSSTEPFRKLFHQGLLTTWAYQRADGSLVPIDEVEEHENDLCIETATGDEVKRIIAKMSKSLRNVINPETVIEEWGADTLRLYEMYMGPLEASKPWNPRDIVGVFRFLQRFWRLAVDEETGELRAGDEADDGIERQLHRTIEKVGNDIPKLAFNTAIASLIEFTNLATSTGTLTRDQLDRIVRTIAPLAPHLAEEIWHRLGHQQSVAQAPWPDFDPAMLVDDMIELPVQVKGKVRSKISVAADADEATVQEIAMADERIAPLLEGETVRKVIVVPGRIVNIITG